MRVALGQSNTTVGDLAGNADRMAHMASMAADASRRPRWRQSVLAKSPP